MPLRRVLRRCRYALVLAAVAVAAGSTAPADVADDAGLQWGLDRIGAPAAWATATGEGMVIAVVDSGVALGHEDLIDKLVPGTACLDTGGDPGRCTGRARDDDGHGTHVAGIAAATTGNGTGISGVAPAARILPVKVLVSVCDGCPASGTAQDVVAGIRWATQQGADVINVSLGSATPAFGTDLAAALADAWAAGSIPVLAAGNDLVRTADLGDAPAVVVSATTRDDGAAAFAQELPPIRWTLSAPGGDGEDDVETCSQDGQPRGVLSTYWTADDPSSAYACLSGTSMAAPHVAGALAVLRSAGLSPADAVEALLATAVDLGAPGPDPTFGAGRIDLAAAMAFALDQAVVPAGDDPVVSEIDGDAGLPRGPVIVAIAALAASAIAALAASARFGVAAASIRRWRRDPAGSG